MLVIKCPHCKTGADFEVAARADPRDSEALRQGVQFVIGFCRLCKNQVFFTLKGNDGSVLGSYPAAPDQAPTELPAEVRRAFNEALVCLGAGAPNASMSMCRRAIQESLDQMGAPKGDLPKQLQALVDQHKITPDLKDWADHARIGGRIAAHGTGGHEWGDASLKWGTREDAQAVVEFCRAFFEYVYVMPERNRQRRAALQKPNPSPATPSGPR